MDFIIKQTPRRKFKSIADPKSTQITGQTMCCIAWKPWYLSCCNTRPSGHRTTTL